MAPPQRAVITSPCGRAFRSNAHGMTVSAAKAYVGFYRRLRRLTLTNRHPKGITATIPGAMRRLSGLSFTRGLGGG